MQRVFIALGSNLGHREGHIQRAIAFMQAHPFISIVAQSDVIETPAMGPPQPAYLNGVVEIHTGLEPLALLETLKAYEVEAGRKSTLRWGPRIIDLDILLYGERVISTEALDIPHRGLAHRHFVLAPLAQLAPHLIPPGQGKSILELLRSLGASASARVSSHPPAPSGL